MVPVNIEDEMKRSYLDYAMSVIVGRALPDVRDGLKPVHRRILYGMNEMGLLSNRPTRKCAKIVGEVLGKYPPARRRVRLRFAGPHGAAFLPCAIRWSMARATSAPSMAIRPRPCGTPKRAFRGSPDALLEDIDKETVDFRPNYDESEVEPEVLPTRVPNLLVNGSVRHRGRHGDQYSAAQSDGDHRSHHPADPPPRYALIENSRDRAGSGFPHRRLHSGPSGHSRRLYAQAAARSKFAPKPFIEKMRKGDREQIVVTEIPYQVNKSRLIETTAALVNEKKIEGISEIRDESDRDGMRIVFELKRGEQAEVILNNLYKNTQLQISFGIINLSIVNGQPRELGLIQTIKYFIEHRADVVRRRTDYELRKAREREHILLGFRLALDNIDEVIRLIRASQVAPRSARVADCGLDVSFVFNSVYLKAAGAAEPLRQLTERQAQAIIELQLQRLTGMEQEKIANELADIQRRIGEYLEILGSEKVLRDLIIKELEEVQKEFGDERRTQIIEDTGEIRLEDLVAGGRRRGHRHARRLSEAHRGRYLPPADARRQGPHRHGHAHRGFRRVLPRRFHPRLPADLHQQRPRLLAQDL